MQICIKIYSVFYRIFIITIFIFLSLLQFSFAQCPENIDFEKGDFTNWTCWAGTVSGGGQTHRFKWENIGAPEKYRHTITNAEDGVDPYGLFPKLCPFGGGASIRLGNDGGGGQCEGVSYKLTIPNDKNTFRLTYYYAVVFQDADHLDEEQPRFIVTVKNVTDNKELPCQIPLLKASSGLDGFAKTPVTPPNQAPNVIAYFKDWTAASIDLNGYAGKTIEVFFKVSDCIFVDHFGYAYVDIDTECSNSPIGAIYCSRDTNVTLYAPPLFEKYRWFNKNNTLLGNEQQLTLKPLPTPGDSIYVEISPYYGYGCTDTLTAFFYDTLSVIANAGADKTFCELSGTKLGENPRKEFNYLWSPAAGLNNAFISNPIALPGVKQIQYTLKVTSKGGGCSASDVVNVIENCPLIKIYVPSAFTPNGDGINDRLHPVLYGFSKVNYFSVYNRTGKMLYTTNNDWPGWDGKINGTALMDIQTVVWIIEAIDVNGKIHKKKGTTVLLQ